MGIALAAASIDIGIVTKDLEKSTAFYRDVVGLEDAGEMPMGGFRLRRLKCGDSTVKLLQFDAPPSATPPGGGLGAATGLRYWTVSVSNLDEVLMACEAAGRPVVEGPTQMRPGVTIALVADPDGNLVEFVNRT